MDIEYSPPVTRKIRHSTAALQPGARIALVLILGLALTLIFCSQALAAAPSYITISLTGNDVEDGGVQASGNRLAWASGPDGQIITWAPGVGAVQVTMNPHPWYVSDLDLSGDRIVWRAAGSTGPPQIHTWTPAGGIVQMTSTGNFKEHPQVSGDRVVWSEYVGSESEIFTWTPTDGVMQITSSPNNDQYPQVSGDRIVWEASDGNNENSATRFEETNSHLAWAGTWASASSSLYSGGSFKYANASGASVTVNFSGVKLDLIGTKAYSYGKMKVTLDGTSTFTVDLYNPTTALYKQTLWSSGLLPLSDHTGTVEWTGDKNPSSTNTYISLDAVDVIGAVK